MVFEYDGTEYKRMVNTLKEGASFGEQALLNADCKRTATVVTRNKSCFLMLDRKHYTEFLAQVEREKVEERINFLKGISIFKNFSAAVLRKLCAHSLRKVKVSRGEFGVYAGKPAHDVIIIESG